MDWMTTIGTVAGGLNAAAAEAERLRLADQARTDALLKAAQERYKGVRELGRDMTAAEDWQGAAGIANQLPALAKKAYGVDLPGGDIVGAPIMKEQLGPPMALGGAMPRVETGRDFSNPKTQAAIAGRVGPQMKLTAEQQEMLKRMGYDISAANNRRNNETRASEGEKNRTSRETIAENAEAGRNDRAEKGRSTRLQVLRETLGANASTDTIKSAQDWAMKRAAFVQKDVQAAERANNITEPVMGPTGKPMPGAFITKRVPLTDAQRKEAQRAAEDWWDDNVPKPTGKRGPNLGPFDPARRGAGAAATGGTAQWAPFVKQASEQYGVPEAILFAVMGQESGGNARARSPVGAQGLMQLMPGTAAGLGVKDAWDPAQNIMGGAKYLRAQYDKFGSWTKALAAYNAGPGAVTKYGGVPPYAETKNYVDRIQKRLRAQGVEISAGEATQMAAFYERHGIEPGDHHA